MSVSQAPTPSVYPSLAPLTAVSSCAASVPAAGAPGGVDGLGTGVTALGATATRTTGLSSSFTVNVHAGTVASPRLVRTVAVPRVAAVTVRAVHWPGTVCPVEPLASDLSGTGTPPSAHGGSP